MEITIELLENNKNILTEILDDFVKKQYNGKITFFGIINIEKRYNSIRIYLDATKIDNFFMNNYIEVNSLRWEKYKMTEQFLNKILRQKKLNRILK